MKRKEVFEIDGWTITFSRNIHMYVHELHFSFNKHINFYVPCESLPVIENKIGIWLYEANIDKETLNKIVPIIKKWEELIEFECEIWVNPISSHV